MVIYMNLPPTAYLAGISRCNIKPVEPRCPVDPSRRRIPQPVRRTCSHHGICVTCSSQSKPKEVSADAVYMRRALALARRALGKTVPNPAVGCVIVKDGIVVGEGFHPKAGLPHAEVYALRAAGERAKGATAYVTLEPCDHYGRTPPCSQALVAAGVKRVVVGVGDPNPLVNGGGVATLRAAGIEVLVGCKEAACREINTEFMERMASQRR
jgi:diaminohydroxyphosphoribosylaminopyrimidine deaminase / 5-amino-6-(5-phosphoribosylamino)uracil reductase